jgi:hypothetical protein
MKDSRAAAYVKPTLTEQRLDRQWDRIATRLDGRSRTAWPVAALGAGALAAVLALGVFPVKRAPGTGDAFVVSSLPEGRQELAFSDGSRVTVAPGGRLRVDHATASDVAMHLEKGTARFEVTHDPARRFAVVIADVEVIDRGTRFEVARGDDVRPGVDVRVEEGEVELRGPAHHEPRRLSAGESWSSRAPEARSVDEPPVASPEAAPAGSARGTESRPNSESRGKTRTEVPRGGSEASAARDLFETGNQAKLEGRLQEAAEAFDALRLRHRSDGHAALAALELGRIRLNHFGDPAGALAALEDAVKLGPRAPFREEAEARIVNALALLGRSAECLRAREQFLTHHPRSVHASAVAGKCAAR